MYCIFLLYSLLYRRLVQCFTNVKKPLYERNVGRKYLYNISTNQMSHLYTISTIRQQLYINVRDMAYGKYSKETKLAKLKEKFIEF